MVGKLAAGVAHEMRNPLTSIKMWLYSLRRAVGTEPDLCRRFETISDEITRLEGIIRSFLEFSRPPALTLASHHAVDVIERTMELMHHRLQAKQVQLIQEHDAALPAIHVDAEQMRQVLVNLIDNAAEAMPSGGVIRVAASSATDPNGRRMVVIRIHDTGCGIPEESRARIFEPFYSTKESGTGLGLCIAANIVARHQGRITVESSAATGTTFAIWIPAAGARADE
jgi:signal transduction histidine kinase